MTDKDFEQFKADVRGLIDDTDRLQAQIASLTAENERLRLAVKLALEIHLECLVDFEEYGLTCSSDIYSLYSAVLQPKEVK